MLCDRTHPARTARAMRASLVMPREERGSRVRSTPPPATQWSRSITMKNSQRRGRALTWAHAAVCPALPQAPGVSALLCAHSARRRPAPAKVAGHAQPAPPLALHPRGVDGGVTATGGLHVDIWPLGLVGDIIRPLGSAKKPGVICQKIPEIDIHLASHLDPDTRDTARPHVRGSGAPSAQT